MRGNRRRSNDDRLEAASVFRALSLQELRERVGDLSQLASTTPVSLTDGPSGGVRGILVRSMGGMSFMVVVDRGLDIGWADVDGWPLAWVSAVGNVSPSRYEPQDRGWLRTFGGGLVTTCGLASVGQPSRDRGEDLGLHGRVSSISASHVTHDTAWDQDGCVTTVTGRVREASAIGDVLEMRRRITTRLGEKSLTIEDLVSNLVPRRAPHMFRYHTNFGFPLVDIGSEIECDAEEVTAPDGGPVKTGQWKIIDAPTHGGHDDVIAVRPFPSNGVATATLRRQRPGPPLSIRLTWSAESLPILLIWRNLLARNYVVSLEPSNCLDDGRAAARARGDLIELEVGQSASHWLRIEVLETPDP